MISLQAGKLVFNQQTPFPKAGTEISARNLAWTLFHSQRLVSAGTGAELEGRQWDVPDELLDIVAYHGHEKKEKTLAMLAKRISKEISGKTVVPGRRFINACLKSRLIDIDEVSVQWLSQRIPDLFEQRDYGVSSQDVGASKIPAALQLKFWELRDPTRYFSPPNYPEAFLQVLLSRQRERETARAEIAKEIARMDDVEKLDLLKGEGELKMSKSAATVMLPAEQSEPEEVLDLSTAPATKKSLPDLDRGRRESTVASTSSRRSLSPTKKSKLTPEEVSPLDTLGLY